MSYFLDSDICIFALNDKFPAIAEKLKDCSPQVIKIPSIVKAELLVGAMQGARPDKARVAVEDFLMPFEIVSFDDHCVDVYVQIRTDLAKKGHPIGPNDFIIASTVLANHGTLVTHNVGEFKRILELEVEDWTRQG